MSKFFFFSGLLAGLGYFGTGNPFALIYAFGAVLGGGMAMGE